MTTHFPDLQIPGVTTLEHEPLAPRTTWKIGGPARWLVEVGARAALVPVLAAARSADLRWAVLGNGSNVLVSDAGFSGVVIVLVGELATVELQRSAEQAQPLQNESGERHRVVAGGGASLTKLLRVAKDEALDGLWVLGGVPGTVGGAVKMNAGTRWGEVSDTLACVELASAEGIATVAAKDLGLAYRHSNIAADQIIASATFVVGDADAAMRGKLDEVLAYRKGSQPLQFASCGSVFANPPGDDVGSAGRLIEAVGLKGHRIGALEVSTQHANWILNLGGGTAADALALIDLCVARVQEKFGITLRPEVQRFGDYAEVTS